MTLVRLAILVALAGTALLGKPGAVSAQMSRNQYYPHPSLPFSVTPPAIPDAGSAGSAYQSREMSPDSWSAPPTVAPSGSLSAGATRASKSFDPYNFNGDAESSEPLLSSEFTGNVDAEATRGSVLTATPSIPNLKSGFAERGQTGGSPFQQSRYSGATTPGRSILRQPEPPVGDSGNHSPSEFRPDQILQRLELSAPGSVSNQVPGSVMVQQPAIESGSRGSLQSLPTPQSLDFAAPTESSVPRVTPQPPRMPDEFQDMLPRPFGKRKSKEQSSLIAPGQRQGNVADQFQYPAGPKILNSQSYGSDDVFRPDLGHRQALPTVRNQGVFDTGQKYDFEEKKKEYPPMSEILATGRYFGSIETLYLQPSFQTNTAITVAGPGSGQSFPFDFDYETAPRARFGFESKYGPGLELTYWQFDQGSNLSQFTASGGQTGEASTWMMGPYRWSRLVAANPGETLTALHSIDVESIQAMVFKELKFPISRLNGSFGFQYLSIAQQMEASLTNGGSLLGEIRSNSDMRAYGPRFMFEYYRPVGHTPFEFISSFGGSVLFGERDQFVHNTLSGEFSRVGADEFVMSTEFASALQYKKMVAENRAWYARVGFQYQTWIGGGTAVDPQDDFGLRGISFGVGYNR